MKIKVSLSEASIDAAIKQLNDYKNGINAKCELLAKRLAEMGGLNVSLGFARAIYDGLNDAAVEVEKVGEGRYRVKASGECVYFAEFGAGVHHPDNYPALPQNANVPNLVGRGQYGKGHGKQNTWAFYGDDPGTNGWTNPKRPGVVFTHGNPANMPMYNTAKDLREQILQVAREVFRT